MLGTVYFVQTADVVTQGSNCGGTAKWQSCRVLVDVALSPAAASLDVVHVTSWSGTKRFLSILMDWFWLWYLSFLRPWCEDCGYDVTQFATFMRYQLPPSSQFKFGNSFSWISVYLQCRYSRTLDHDMIKAVFRNVAGFINISTTKRGKRVNVRKHVEIIWSITMMDHRQQRKRLTKKSFSKNTMYSVILVIKPTKCTNFTNLFLE